MLRAPISIPHKPTARLLPSSCHCHSAIVPSSLLTRYVNTVEVIGYLVRMVAHNKTGVLMPYVIQNMFILLAPILFAASIYMTLSRIIIRLRGERFSPIRTSRLTKIFVTGDITALLVQGGAGGMMVVNSLANIGQTIIIVGLVFHVCIFGIFITVTAMFHLRLQAYESQTSKARDASFANAGGLIRMLYVCSGLIMFRSIFRVVEFAMGMDAYLLSTEWPLYVFDALPMFVVMVVFWKWFPSDVQTPVGGNVGQVELEEATPGMPRQSMHLQQPSVDQSIQIGFQDKAQRPWSPA